VVHAWTICQPNPEKRFGRTLIRFWYWTACAFGSGANTDANGDPSRSISGVHASHADLGMQREDVPHRPLSIYRLRPDMP